MSLPCAFIHQSLPSFTVALSGICASSRGRSGTFKGARASQEDSGNMSGRNVPHVPHGGVTTHGTAHKSQLKTVTSSSIHSNATNYCDCHKNTRPMHQQLLSFRTTQWYFHRQAGNKLATMECVLRGELGHGLDQLKLELSELHLIPYLAGCRQHFVPEVRIKS